MTPKDFSADTGFGGISINMFSPDTVFTTAESWGDRDDLKMHFDYGTNQWIFNDKIVCREISITEPSTPLYYLNIVHGAETDGIVTKEGILALNEGVEPPMPHTELYWLITKTITFDNGVMPIRAKCNQNI